LQRSILDALAAGYPMLRGTIHDRVTHQRRPFVRFFAREQDLPRELPDAPLPDTGRVGGAALFVVGPSPADRDRSSRRWRAKGVALLCAALNSVDDELH